MPWVASSERGSPAVLAVPIASAVRRGRAAEIRGACSAIVIVSCVLMLEAPGGLAPQAASTLAIAVCAFGVLALRPVPPLFVILGSALVGLLVS
jgi:hypothetical protein